MNYAIKKSALAAVDFMTIILCLGFFAGCSEQPNRDAVTSESDGETEDGGGVENPDREKVESYFIALGKVQSAEEEKNLLSEFGDWLTEKGYTISVVEKDEKHELTCPYFPPVTPWVVHGFLDIENLERLPRSVNGER